MVVLKTIRHLSESVEEYFNITRQVHDIVRESGVKNGFVAVITAHTTTGIVVNEALPCVEADISEMLEKSVPLEAPYLHAHFLPTYGATSNNSQGHLKACLPKITACSRWWTAKLSAAARRISTLWNSMVRSCGKCL